MRSLPTMSAPDTAAVRRSPWAAPHALSASPTASRLLLAARVAGLGVFALADVVMIKGTVDIVLQQSDAVSWFIAILLGLGAVAMATTTGHLARVAAEEGRSATLAHLLVVGWLALGVALVALRANAATWTVPPPLVEGVAAPAFDEAAMHQGIAALLALLYLSSGVWAYVEGRQFNPVLMAFSAAQARLERYRVQEIGQRALALRSAEDVQRARGQLTELHAARQAAEAAWRALAEQLMTEARVRMAIHLGDPAATGITELAPRAAALGREEEGR